MSLDPLCFVVMPFGTKPDARRRVVDFDAVYTQLLAPAIKTAGMVPLRADEELVGGLIHKPMYERLILADYAVVDLTTANANVFYELGVRHAVRPYSTVLVNADIKSIPFDLAPDRVLAYELDRRGRPANVDQDLAALVAALTTARETSAKAMPDSPVFQLVEGLAQPDIDRLKTDVFRNAAEYSSTVKQRLATARRTDEQDDPRAALRAVEVDLGPLGDVEAGVLVDLLLSYRATKAWNDMVRVVEAMPEPVRRTRLVREQYGFALNRAGRSEDAEQTLQAVITDFGPSSETYGLLGRVYKERWERLRNGSPLRAEGELDQAIKAYRTGFETDWRDAYPGVNAVTLMEIRQPGADAQQALIPVVRYANRRRIDGDAADYWDHATRLELGVIARDKDEAQAGARDALATVRESWEPESTAYNLSLVRDARAEQGERIDWADAIVGELEDAAKSAARKV